MPKKGTSWDKAWRPAAEALLHSLTLQGLPGVVAQAQNTAGEILDQPCETLPTSRQFHPRSVSQISPHDTEAFLCHESL